MLPQFPSLEMYGEQDHTLVTFWRMPENRYWMSLRHVVAAPTQRVRLQEGSTEEVRRIPNAMQFPYESQMEGKILVWSQHVRETNAGGRISYVYWESLQFLYTLGIKGKIDDVNNMWYMEIRRMSKREVGRLYRVVPASLTFINSRHELATVLTLINFAKEKINELGKPSGIGTAFEMLTNPLVNVGTMFNPKLARLYREFVTREYGGPYR